MGYRKFAVTIFTILCATVLCYIGKVTDGVYSGIIIAVVGGYFTSNVIKGKTLTLVEAEAVVATKKKQRAVAEQSEVVLEAAYPPKAP